MSLASAGQGDVEDWLLTGPAAANVRGFLLWAGQHAHADIFDIPLPARSAHPATDTDQRWDWPAC